MFRIIRIYGASFGTTNIKIKIKVPLPHGSPYEYVVTLIIIPRGNALTSGGGSKYVRFDGN